MSNNSHSTPPRQLWIISVPGRDEAFDKLDKSTSKLSTNIKFNVPDLKVGTLDQLVTLSDDLQKLDVAAEQLTRKMTHYFGEIFEECEKLAENLVVGNRNMYTYLTKFQWESSKYPLKQSMQVIAEMIAKQMTQIDNDFKTKAAHYNNYKNTLNSLDRKSTGSLATRDISDLVKPEDFVLDSDYLQTVAVAVPKLMIKEWKLNYATYADMVVYKSEIFITEDKDHALYTVTLFKKSLEEYRANCRQNKIIVRDFVYDAEALNNQKTMKEKIYQEKEKQYASIFRWLKINFGEIFSAFIHIKALRTFVESVLRYGLPVNFQAVIMEPNNKGTAKKLHTVLGKMHEHRDGSDFGPMSHVDDITILESLSITDYYPYVFLKVPIDFANFKH